MLEVGGLSFGWSENEEPLLRGVSFDARDGEILAILGPNGAGKSTLLGLLGARLQPEAGWIRLNGTPPTALEVNYMLQDSDRQLFSHLTLAQNIEVGRRGCTADSIIAALFEERGSLGRFPSHCSGGQRQRAVLTRTLADVTGFPLTLMDEPFARLSVDARRETRVLLVDRVRESRTPAVVVSHDIPEAIILADRALVLGKRGTRLFDTRSVTSEKALHEQEELRAEIVSSLLGLDEVASPRMTGEVG